MSKRDDEEVLDLLKRLQIGDYLDMEEVDYFEDNKQCLRAARTFYSGVLKEAKFLVVNPSPRSMEDKRKDIREKYAEFVGKRKKGEEKNGEKFDSTKFYDEKDLDEGDRCVLDLLLSKKGIGVMSHKFTVEGEVLIAALKLLLDMDAEDARKRLTRSSVLRENDMISVVNHRDRRLPRKLRERRKHRRAVEWVDFQVNDWVIDGLYGDYELETEEVEEKEPSTENKILNKVEPDVELSDVVLQEDMKESVVSLVEQNRNRQKFMEDWNMKSIVGERKGLNLLLSGPPGTGKTMMAKGLAKELDKDLFVLSFSDVMNHWFGKTEKNAKKIFDILNDTDAVLLIDEADAILQRRSPSRTSCDRSENRVINILLQGMENHDGIIVFTTNIAIGLDRAMERRMDLKLELPVPSVEAREKIWEYHIPEELPLDENVDFGALAEEYEFCGGYIRNAVLNATRSAIRKGNDSVEMEDFLKGCEKEMKGKEVMNFYLKGEDDEEQDIRGYA